MSVLHDENLECDRLGTSLPIFRSKLDKPLPGLSAAHYQSSAASQFRFNCIKCAVTGATFSWKAVAVVAIWPGSSKITMVLQ